MTAREINRMITDAGTRGKNIYAVNLLDSVGLTHSESIRVVRAKTNITQIKCRATNGTWYRAYYATDFDER